MFIVKSHIPVGIPVRFGYEWFLTILTPLLYDDRLVNALTSKVTVNTMLFDMTVLSKT